MSKKDIFVSIELVEDVYSEDIPSTFTEGFGFDYLKDHDFYEIPISFGKAESEPIDIDKAISILQELKEKNSTHVQIEYHSDHQQYIFSGMKVEIASDELVGKFKEYNRKKKILEDSISKKELEIRIIKNQILKL